MRKMLTSIMSVMALVFSTNSIAQGTSIDIDYMMLSSDLNVLSFDTTALQLRVSNPINANIDVEGAIAFGVGDDSYSAYDPGVGNVKLSAKLGNMLGVFAKLHTDPSLGYQFYGRIGLAKVAYDFKYSSSVFGSTSESYDDTGLAFGFGGSFNISTSGAIIVEYNQLPNVNFSLIPELGDIETTTITLGVQLSI